MNKKSISINPAFFKISSKERKKKKKPTFKNKLKPNDIKKKLIAKIKEHQKKEREKELEEKEKEDNTFKNEFQETLSYLEEMKKKKNKKKEQRKTMKKKIFSPTPSIEPLIPNINIDIEPMNAVKDPPYGCLKGGNKPTWREYNKTLKRNKEEIQQEYVLKPPFFNINNNDYFNDRKDKLEKLQAKFKSINEPEKPKKSKIKNKRIRRKITLGKIKNKVGVLVKSKQTRKIVKNEVNILKKKSIQEVKDYLRKHNLTKIGSNAPDYILRSTYENAYLSGDITNKNPDILLHNWHKEEEQ